MASPDFSMPVAGVPRKPKTSIYTILLVISLIALLTGCIFLFLEIKRFGGFGTVRGTVQVMASPGSFQFAALPCERELFAV